MKDPMIDYKAKMKNIKLVLEIFGAILVVLSLMALVVMFANELVK